MYSNKETGTKGEDFAAGYLEQMGISILDRNFRCRFGEIDIVALEDETVIFIEVKTRKTIRFGLPEESVTWRKQQKIRSLAAYYLEKRRLQNAECRFDVCSVYLNSDGELKSIELIHNCF